LINSRTPPRRIETHRLVLRVCEPDEAHLLRAAIDISLDRLRAWLPWAMKEPSSIDQTRELLARGARRFAEGEDFMYTIFDQDETEVLGGAGLHRRAETDCLEIGYWIRADQIGKGYATEAARALTAAALAVPGIHRVQIDCDPRNHQSIRIPEKLGYQLLELRTANKLTPTGAPRDTMVFELGRAGSASLA
jgi:RimJ/RimL family protein N-acetyltransferase